MIARLHFPTAERGTAFGLPIDEAVERVVACARELNTAADKTREGDGFAQRLVKAVQNRVTSTTRPRIGVLANAAVAPTAEGSKNCRVSFFRAEDESFAERVKKACEEKSGQKRRKEQAERERSRYTHQPRKPTKGE